MKMSSANAFNLFKAKILTSGKHGTVFKSVDLTILICQSEYRLVSSECREVSM